MLRSPVSSHLLLTIDYQTGLSQCPGGDREDRDGSALGCMDREFREEVGFGFAGFATGFAGFVGERITAWRVAREQRWGRRVVPMAYFVNVVDFRDQDCLAAAIEALSRLSPLCIGETAGAVWVNVSSDAFFFKIGEARIRTVPSAANDEVLSVHAHILTMCQEVTQVNLDKVNLKIEGQILPQERLRSLLARFKRAPDPAEIS